MIRRPFGSGNLLTLPDSRLTHRPEQGCFMADWELPDGTTVRIEVQPYYCGNCGRLGGHCPKENVTFQFWLCRKCFETYGQVAGTYACPDDQFCEAVEQEMLAKYGRGLTVLEIAVASESGALGTALEKLEKESPFPVPSR